MKTLFDATQIGSMPLKNRIWRSATWMNMADDKGHMTPRLEKAYMDLAKGGVGTIITGYAFVLPEEQPNPGMMGIYDDSFVPEYLDFTKKIHSHGANIVMQIVYGGSFTNHQPEHRTIWGASAVPHPLTQVVPTEMTTDDIQTVITAMAKAAGRVKASGFDGVQIHAAHTYLFSQFLSPYYNRRTDAYGGSIHNRARIVYESLGAIRDEVGPDFNVFIKMHCSDEWGENGLNENESLEVAKRLESLGISGIEFSGGHLDIKADPNAGPARTGIIKAEKQSYFAKKTTDIAAHLTVPVISVGGHRTPKTLESHLNASRIDYVALCRPLIAEPNLINRWQAGDHSKLRCVACGKCFGKNGTRCVLDEKKA